MQVADFASISQLSGASQFRQFRARCMEERKGLHLQMVEVVRAAKITGCPLYLQKHGTAAGVDGAIRDSGMGQPWRLRWRMAVQGNFKHVTWDEAQPMLKDLPVAVVRHLRQLNRRAEELNLVDALLQVSIARIEKFLGMRGPGVDVSTAELEA